MAGLLFAINRQHNIFYRLSIIQQLYIIAAHRLCAIVGYTRIHRDSFARHCRLACSKASSQVGIEVAITDAYIVKVDVVSISTLAPKLQYHVRLVDVFREVNLGAVPSIGPFFALCAKYLYIVFSRHFYQYFKQKYALNIKTIAKLQDRFSSAFERNLARVIRSPAVVFVHLHGIEGGIRAVIIAIIRHAWFNLFRYDREIIIRRSILPPIGLRLSARKGLGKRQGIVGAQYQFRGIGMRTFASRVLRRDAKLSRVLRTREVIIKVDAGARDVTRHLFNVRPSAHRIYIIGKLSGVDVETVLTLCGGSPFKMHLIAKVG